MADTCGKSTEDDQPDDRSRRHGGGGHRAPHLVLSRLLPEGRFFACEDMVVTGFSADPNRCRPGDVFVARLGADGDGHDAVGRALARGAAGVIAERMVPTFGAALCLVPSTDRALVRLAHAAAGDPARRLRMIAVTGTSGKTTTAWLAASVLAEAGIRVGVLSDLGCLGADDSEPVGADIERPEVLAQWLRRLVDGGCTHAVVEVSSGMLATACLDGIDCDTVVATNLAVAHLDLHGTAKAYREVKSRILDALRPDGCLIGNADDRRIADLLARRAVSATDGRSITVGLRAAADVTATLVERSLLGQTVLVQAGSHTLPITVPAPVAGFVRNSMLAVAVGLRYGLPLERIARGIEAAGSVSGRLERIDRGQDHAAFVDHPTSGHALAATLSGLRRLTVGRLVVLAETALAARLMGDEAALTATVRGGGRGAADRFERRAGRWADECVVVPDTVMEECGGSVDIMAYARIDRLLSSLTGEDCLLVLGRPRSRGFGPPEPDGDPLSLAAVVDGWLQLAHGPQPLAPGRRAA